MEIFGMEKLSLVDFDGYVAATVFTGTCNFRCGFCHNGPLVTEVDSLKIMDNDEIFSYLEKRRGVLDGVCITGGEPTLQKDLPDFCLKLKNMGLKVKLDTNGTNPDMVKLLDKEKLCDYFAMDIKNDKENYAKTIGFSSFLTVAKWLSYGIMIMRCSLQHMDNQLGCNPVFYLTINYRIHPYFELY